MTPRKAVEWQLEAERRGQVEVNAVLSSGGEGGGILGGGGESVKLAVSMESGKLKD